MPEAELLANATLVQEPVDPLDLGRDRGGVGFSICSSREQLALLTRFIVIRPLWGVPNCGQGETGWNSELDS